MLYVMQNTFIHRISWFIVMFLMSYLKIDPLEEHAGLSLVTITSCIGLPTNYI